MPPDEPATAIRPSVPFRGAVLAVVLYALSLPLPAFWRGGMTGFDCLVIVLVWPGLAFTVPAWFANPAFFAGVVCLCCGPGRWAYRWGVVSLVLAATAVLYGVPGPAFVLWVLAMVVLVRAGRVAWDQAPPTREPAHDYSEYFPD